MELNTIESAIVVKALSEAIEVKTNIVSNTNLTVPKKIKDAAFTDREMFRDLLTKISKELKDGKRYAKRSTKNT